MMGMIGMMGVLLFGVLNPLLFPLEHRGGGSDPSHHSSPLWDRISFEACGYAAVYEEFGAGDVGCLVGC